MAAEIERKLKVLVHDTNQQCVSKISHQCTQALQACTDQKLFAEMGFSQIKTSLEQLKLEVGDKIPMVQLAEFQKASALTRDQFDSQLQQNKN